jgi:twitching motility protein PilU
MTKRGLVIFVGGTGTGKSTSLAALVGYRNENSLRPHHHDRGSDRIRARAQELHDHPARSRRRHRFNWFAALKNTLRQAPDVILIGEIRDRETMEYAIAFAETGHLCLSTLHANSANQALDRIINFFPEESAPSC